MKKLKLKKLSNKLYTVSKTVNNCSKSVLMKNLFARKRSDFFRQNDDTIRCPAKMLERANKELLDLGVDKFATMAVGVIDIINNALSYKFIKECLEECICDENKIKEIMSLMKKKRDFKYVQEIKRY